MRYYGAGKLLQVIRMWPDNALPVLIGWNLSCRNKTLIFEDMYIKVIIAEQRKNKIKKKITKSMLRETWLNKYAGGSQSGVFYPQR